MGEKSYWIKDSLVAFSEANDDISCLCTFPHNNEVAGNIIDSDQVRSLAYLGAMVCLLHRNRLSNRWNYIPQDLPQWIKDEIDKQIPIDTEGEE